MDTYDPVTALAKALNAYVVSQDHIAEAGAKLAAETQPETTTNTAGNTEGGSGGVSPQR